MLLQVLLKLLMRTKRLQPCPPSLFPDMLPEALADDIASCMLLAHQQLALVTCPLEMYVPAMFHASGVLYVALLALPADTGMSSCHPAIGACVCLKDYVAPACRPQIPSPNTLRERHSVTGP